MDEQREDLDILMDDVFAAEEEFLEHVGRSVLDGAPIGSGRYRYGSGDNAYQRVKNFQTTSRDFSGQGSISSRRSFSIFTSAVSR